MERPTESRRDDIKPLVINSWKMVQKEDVNIDNVKTASNIKYVKLKINKYKKSGCNEIAETQDATSKKDEDLEVTYVAEESEKPINYFEQIEDHKYTFRDDNLDSNIFEDFHSHYKDSDKQNFVEYQIFDSVDNQNLQDTELESFENMLSSPLGSEFLTSYEQEHFHMLSEHDYFLDPQIFAPIKKLRESSSEIQLARILKSENENLHKTSDGRKKIFDASIEILKNARKRREELKYIVKILKLRNKRLDLKIPRLRNLIAKLRSKCLISEEGMKKLMDIRIDMVD